MVSLVPYGAFLLCMTEDCILGQDALASCTAEMSS